MAAIPKHRQLPDKENKLFRELLTQYELKQYKKGLKVADTILKKFPNHGETLAIKALTLHSSLPDPPTASSMPKREEAEAMARLAVKKDITSHITWHVLGILAKNRKDWDEASRAFAMARRQDPDNIPLIRDSIALLTHTRQYDAAVQVRHHYTVLRPQIRSAWLGLVIAHELAGDREEAIKTYDLYQSAVQNDGANAQEKAQILLHIIQLCVDAGRNEEALDRLEKGTKQGVISPRGEVSQIKADILTALGRTDEALQTYQDLLKQNPDNLAYYRGYFKTKGIDIAGPLDDATRASLLQSLDEFSQTFPRSSAPRRLALDVAQGKLSLIDLRDKFRELARAYIIKGLERGVPSLFVDIKSIYSDQQKMTAVGEIVEDIISKLEKDSTLSNDGTIAPPTVLLWAYYYLALHLAHPLNPIPSYSRSLQLLSLALDHTPTLPELYMAKAIVLKRSGDPLGAAHEMEKARLLDGQDRFLNGKAAKYWFRAGDIEKAEQLLGMFTKKDVTPAQDLTDLQSLWFLQESGDAYRLNGNIGMALKRYQTVAKVFQEYEDDQYDFHGYCARRMTFQAYTHLLKYEENLRSHPGYAKAALAAIDIYLRVNDDPSIIEEKLTPEQEAERKKAAKKAQKAEQKAKKAAAASGEKKEEAPLPDDDPDGQKLLKSETLLDDALKLWKPLEAKQGERVEVWLAGYEIYMRKKMFLAALRCLLQAQALSPSNPTLHAQILALNRLASSLPADVPEPVVSTIKHSLPTLLPAGKSPEAFNTEYFEARKAASDAKGLLGAAKGRLEVVPEDVDGAVNILRSLISVQADVKTLQEALTFAEAKAGTEKTEELRRVFVEKVPLAWVLRGQEERKKRKEELLEAAQGEEGKADV
ncbi:peptide alpha-N-acetyltransferase [Cryptococcus deuterogattii 2001/935-1]|nr:peptide alpha-N-acetyltransferase [Cryptococcus deuterogattii 2001/935-1]